MTSRMTPAEIIRRVGSGLLAFHVTHFDAAGAFQEAPYRDHYGWMLDHQVAALIAKQSTMALTPAATERLA
ncbi:MAG: 5-dehydro-4-deoxyglucarate dehydratase [Caulobacteraceae bacterium]|nr:5-dehydro-4-deoxyglucarate dehydratase [Caulobacteraceae bacterium]